MKRTAAITIAIAGLLLAGCGSDSKDGTQDETTASTVETTVASTVETSAEGDGQVTEAQSEAAETAIDGAKESGVDLDQECVEDVASRLSDEDAEIIASGADEAVSAEGEALSMELLGCVDEDALVDLFVEGMSQSGQDFDEACIREQLENFDVAEIVAASQGSEPPADVVAAMNECVNGG